MKKIFFDFFPIILFFIFFKIYDIYYATGVLMIAFVIQITYELIRYKKVDPMHIMTLVLVLVFGGLTIYFHNDRFIQWKVTVINWLFGAIVLISQYIFKKNLLQSILAKNIKMKTDKPWLTLNNVWIIYFILLGALNLYIAYAYPLSTWVNFKTFGLIGITLVFVICQSVYLHKHIDDQ